MTSQHLLFIFLSIYACNLHSEELPLWELGGGIGFLSSPHYLGANQRSNYVVPVPYGVYRGEYIQSDKGGLAGKIYDSHRLDLRLSLGGALPVDSEDNNARSGMPDLGFMLEAGPTLQYSLHKQAHSVIRLDFPVRIALSLDKNKLNYRGFTTNPKLFMQYHFNTWRFSSNIGPTFGTQHYHDYFYTVDSQYAQADRSEYQAQAGYTGFRTSVSASKLWGNLYTGLFVNYYYLGGSNNDTSPLMKTNNYASFGLAISWIFAKAQQQVEYDHF